MQFFQGSIIGKANRVHCINQQEINIEYNRDKSTNTIVFFLKTKLN